MPNDPLRFTLRLPHSHFPSSPKAIRQVAEAAEEMGFYGVSAQDHIVIDPNQVPDTGGDGDKRDIYGSISVLSFVAAITKRIKLLTSIVVLSYRHPVMLAKETATLDALSEGRLLLGVGVGAMRQRESAEGFKLGSHAWIARQEYDALGVKGHRGAAANECLQVLDALWTTNPTTFHGERTSVEHMEFFPKPVQKPRPPILVGGRAEAALQRAALYADGWMPSHESVEHFIRGRQRVMDLAREAGRPEPKWWGVNIDLAVAATDAKAHALMEGTFGDAYETKDAMQSATLAGSPETVVKQLERWRSAGLNLADLKIVPRDVASTIEQMRIMSREIMPAVAKLS